ncbi:MAG: hypothetical protein A2X94_06660 [Bdellovibrionales bacterium GWB1_55_8]|nr:MAG: hypothetical protein A2X94_06660 [Bdellovibrionales bacterium GWB1_55_8]
MPAHARLNSNTFLIVTSQTERIDVIDQAIRKPRLLFMRHVADRALSYCGLMRKGPLDHRMAVVATRLLAKSGRQPQG